MVNLILEAVIPEANMAWVETKEDQLSFRSYYLVPRPDMEFSKAKIRINHQILEQWLLRSQEGGLQGVSKNKFCISLYHKLVQGFLNIAYTTELY